MNHSQIKAELRSQLFQMLPARYTVQIAITVTDEQTIAQIARRGVTEAGIRSEIAGAVEHLKKTLNISDAPVKKTTSKYKPQRIVRTPEEMEAILESI